MKRYDKFKNEFTRLDEKESKLQAERQELQQKLAGSERLLYDLKIQRELDEDNNASIDKQILSLQKETDALKSDIKSLSERIEALDAGKFNRLESLREDAKADVVKKADKLGQQYASKLQDLKQARGVIVGILLDLHKTRQESSELINEFKGLSGRIDVKYEKLTGSCPLVNLRALKDNTSGDHAPHISPDSELQRAIDGMIPQWWPFYELSGEILSPSEIAAKERK